MKSSNYPHLDHEFSMKMEDNKIVLLDSHERPIGEISVETLLMDKLVGVNWEQVPTNSFIIHFRALTKDKTAQDHPVVHVK